MSWKGGATLISNCISFDNVLLALSVNLCVRLAFSFAPSLTVLVYKGDKERRTEIQQEANSQDFHVLLTTYEVGGY